MSHWRIFRVALLAVCLAGTSGSAFAQLQTTTPFSGSVADGAASRTVQNGSSSTDNAQASGQVSATLCPNDASSAGGTYYHAKQDGLPNAMYGPQSPSSGGGRTGLYGQGATFGWNIAGQTTVWVNKSVSLLPCGNTPRWQVGTYNLGWSATDGAINTVTLTNGGSGYVDGTYSAVAMTGGTGGTNGLAQAKFDLTVAGGIVTAVAITSTGSNHGMGYTASDVLSASNANLGGTGSGLQITVTDVNNNGKGGGFGHQGNLSNGVFVSTEDIDGIADIFLGTSLVGNTTASSTNIPLTADPCLQGIAVNDAISQFTVTDDPDDAAHDTIPANDYITALHCVSLGAGSNSIDINVATLLTKTAYAFYRRADASHWTYTGHEQGRATRPLNVGYSTNMGGTAVSLGTGLGGAKVPFRRTGSSGKTFIDSNDDLSVPNVTSASVLVSGGSCIVATCTSTHVTGVAPGSSGNVLTSNGSAWTSAAPAGGSVTRDIVWAISGSGATITTGSKFGLTVDYACTISQWTIVGDQSGSIVIDVWKLAFNQDNNPTVANTITASAKPTVSSHKGAQSSTLTGWTTSISAGDTLFFNVDSVTSMQFATISLKCA